MCGAQIADKILQTSQPPHTPQTQAETSETYILSGCRLPPCDTDVFTGDYLRWPTFRDLLTVIYINNPRLEIWDCRLVYMCFSKHPKLTLSLWEQSLHDKANIPNWQELNVFLAMRHRTLEAKDDVLTSCSSQSQPRESTTRSASRRINSYEARVAPKPRGLMPRVSPDVC